MKICKIHDLTGQMDLSKYTPYFQGSDLLKQIFTDHSQLLNVKGIKLNIQQEKVSDVGVCQDCTGIDFIRTGTCHVCLQCGSSQGCS